jgi:hypothetical protein
VKNGVIQETPLIIKTGLAEPEGMALEQDGNLLVAKTGAHRAPGLDWLASGRQRADWRRGVALRDDLHRG